MKCPRCGAVLHPSKEDDVEVQVCSGCKGEWLASEDLYKLIEHHNEVFTSSEVAAIEGVNKQLFTAERDDHDELECPECGAQMEHTNYGDTSGIILHKCTECEGIWMDKDQLHQVEALVDGWKSKLEQDSTKYGGVLKKVELQEQAELDRNVSVSKIGFVNAILRRFCE